MAKNTNNIPANSCKTQLDIQKKWINTYWIMGVLIFVIIVMVTLFVFVNIENPEKFIEYINGGATFLSITLSILAIVFTYTANTEIARQFDNINHAAANIKDTSNQLISSEKNIQNAVKHIQEDVSIINSNYKAYYDRMDVAVNKLNEINYTQLNVSPESQKKLKDS